MPGTSTSHHSEGSPAGELALIYASSPAICRSFCLMLGGGSGQSYHTIRASQVSKARVLVSLAEDRGCWVTHPILHDKEGKEWPAEI
jgi:hypothetical protein